MKKKKIMLIGIITLVVILLVTLVTILIVKSNNKSPVAQTKEYMNHYQKLDKDIIKNIKYEYTDDLTPTQKEKYIDIMKRQYENIEYDIREEVVNKTDAIITVEFTVYDLSSAMERANSYVEVYSDKFMKGNKFDPYKATDYKLKTLMKYDERVTYSIDFFYYKEKGKWKMTDLGEVDLKKINGTF